MSRSTACSVTRSSVSRASASSCPTRPPTASARHRVPGCRARCEPPALYAIDGCLLQPARAWAASVVRRDVGNHPRGAGDSLYVARPAKSPREIMTALAANSESLFVEDVPTDARDAPLFLRPIGADVARVEVERALELRRVAVVVDGLGDLLRALPFVAGRLGQLLEFGPGEGADHALAQGIPRLLVDDLAQRAREEARRLAVHGHLGDRELAGDRLAARFEIDVAGEAGEALVMEGALPFPSRILVGEHRLQRVSQAHDDAGGEDGEEPRRLVGAVPEEAHVAAQIGVRGNHGGSLCRPTGACER